MGSLVVRACLALSLLTSSFSFPHGPSARKLRQARDTPALVQPIYRPFPLGSIKPRGWFKDQLTLEGLGLAGNLFDFYRFVRDSMWLGGSSEYSTLHESSPYWFNGLVPLAFGLDDSRLQRQVFSYLDYVLDHQQSDGWFGPETTRQTRGLWARCYFLLGLMQYAQADALLRDRIVDSMHRYVQLAHSMLKDNFTGLIPKQGDEFDGSGWGPMRAHEMHIPLQWLYEEHPRNNSQIIWETLELMIEGSAKAGADWRTYWVKGVYPEVIYDPQHPPYHRLFNHGVNVAEGLRYPLAIYRMTHDDSLRTQTRTAVDLLAQYHKSLAGTIIADEFVTDLNPSRGAELCTAAELAFSMAYIYQYLGDNDLADWAEQVTFNAVPASIFPDWWSHQYVQQENQPWSRNLSVYPEMWSNVGSHGNVFGLEPDYPCCTVNHPQAYPKFLANSFALTEDGGIAHILLSPGSVATSLGSNQVKIDVDTAYPFGHSLRYTITANDEFTFYVRIPGWADDKSSTIIGGTYEQPQPLSPSDKGLQKVRVGKGLSSLTVNLDTQPRVVTRANNTAAVYYGALLYSLAIDTRVTEVPLVAYDGGEVPFSSTTPHTHDHEIEPTSTWNVAIDPSQIKVVRARNAGQNGDGDAAAPDAPLSNPVWDIGGSPVELRVAAVEIDWPLAFDSAADPPLEPRVTGKPFAARFVPFGSAKIHMAHLPVVQLAKVDLDAAEKEGGR
ncbi:hypothetical protein GGS23DRAFT_603201 [Durotheca rogersii]|uniref:uncharacterized protein n=1 Tax=Durotheca rogersii TaxID=419775 RepID=UPI00221FF663|nr:uncharacterized protein GGS23DRAFT_603201 [Durotheca rogersii]KAI5867086.1 hypothetical protein GGS23DRAFT_603201 [Durotheca rogersii]